MLLHLLFFPDTTVCLIQALPMANLSALKHLCKELWKQIDLSLSFFFILFREALTGLVTNTSHASISHEVFSQKVPLGNLLPFERDYFCST